MDSIDRAELERRLRLNEAELKSKGASADLGFGETLLFVATIVVVSLVALLWSQS